MLPGTILMESRLALFLSGMTLGLAVGFILGYLAARCEILERLGFTVTWGK